MGLNPLTGDIVTVTTPAKTIVVPTVPVTSNTVSSNTGTPTTVKPNPTPTIDVRCLENVELLEHTGPEKCDDQVDIVFDDRTSEENQPEIDIDALKNIISKGSFFVPFPDAADNIQKILDNHIFKDRLVVPPTTTCPPCTNEPTTTTKPCDGEHSLAQSCQKCSHEGVDKLLIYLQKKQPSCSN